MTTTKPVTAETITDEMIRALRQEMVGNRRRLNAYTRSVRRDCDGALSGSAPCRESCAAAWNKLQSDYRSRSDGRCTDPSCQRESGHRGMHMSRSWDSYNSLEIIDEWGDMDPAIVIAHAESVKRP